MSIRITKYEAICNAGSSIKEISQNALSANTSFFVVTEDIIKSKPVRVGLVFDEMPKIISDDFDLRCNQMLLKVCNLMKSDLNALKARYGAENIGVVVATTNSGVQEFECSKNLKHCEIGNSAEFLKRYLGLKNFASSVSTACSSGIKAFSIGCELINSGICGAVIVAGVDSMARVPVYGFSSLEVLSGQPAIPFSKNRKGINIGEAAGIFILEKDVKEGIEIAGIGETTDIYHSTTPDPEAKEEVRAIKLALENAGISKDDVDYVNLHGTGTISNDLMESNAVYKVFEDKVPVSSTKPITGHCLGAAGTIETALCCKLLDSESKKLYPHVFDGFYDESLPKINLVSDDCEVEKVDICLTTSFGFGGTNSAMVLKRGKVVWG